MADLVPVVWSNDDISCGDTDKLTRMLGFLDRHGIPGVFFCIPRGHKGDLDQDRDLLACILAARQRGHEFHQHGFMHQAYECGVPELLMLQWSEAEYARFDTERDAIEAQHTYEAQVRMLDQGRRIWRRAFGEDSVGFRPGWGAYCGNLYRALADLGYAWVSSRIPCFTSWARQNPTHGCWDIPLEFRPGIPRAPQLLSQGVIEFPMAGDYAFRVPNRPEHLRGMVRLGLDEFADHAAHGTPMIITSHWHGLAHPGDEPAHPTGTGYAIHEELIPALRSDGRASFMGMAGLAERYRHLRPKG